MPTYLLTWNPKRYPFARVAKFAEDTAGGKARMMTWSTGNRNTIERGDRVFLLRQGRTPKGIIAAGWVTRGSFQDDHWGGLRGHKVWYVTARYERILDQP
jgi:hypothetical protein